MGFNIGDALVGAAVGFLETGNPIAAGAIGAVDGFTNQNFMSGDSMSAGGSDASSLMAYSQLADAFAGS